MSLFHREARGASTLEGTLRVGTRYGRNIIGGYDSTVDSAQRVLAVWGCGRVISDTVGSMPWDVVRVGQDDRTPLEKPKLIDKPDGGDDLAWKRKVIWSVVLTGNAYGIVTETTADSRYPTRINLVHPNHVHWTIENGVEKPVIDGKTHELWPVGDVWHLAGYEKPGSVVGMSPIAHAATVISMGAGAQTFVDDFFRADAHPSAVVKSKQMLTATQAQAIKDSARKAVSDRDLLVLGADLEWEQIQVSPTDSQFLETMQYTAQQICGALFGVPPEILGFATSGSSVTYASVTDRDTVFLKYGLAHWITRLEKAMSRLLPGNQTVKFNTGVFLKLDLKGRMEVYRASADVYSRSGKPVFTNDEIRAFEDLASLPDDYPLPPVRAHNPLSPNATEDLSGITP